MDETELETLKQTSLAMYVSLNALYELHAQEEVTYDDENIFACAHCSALADGVVHYPCPSVQILLTDFTSETSEPAESEELSS